MDINKIASNIPEDPSAPISEYWLFEAENVAEVVYTNYKGQQRTFRIIPELTEDAGSVWVVALAGTGQMGVRGAALTWPRGSRVLRRAKNWKYFKNPDWSPNSVKKQKEWKEKFKEYLVASGFENWRLKDIEIPDGFHDEDVFERNFWQLQSQFAKEIGENRPNHHILKATFSKEHGHMPIGTWYSRPQRNDTYKRISLVKSRVISGLPGPKPGEEVKHPIDPDLYYGNPGAVPHPED